MRWRLENRPGSHNSGSRCDDAHQHQPLVSVGGDLLKRAFSGPPSLDKNSGGSSACYIVRVPHKHLQMAVVLVDEQRPELCQVIGRYGGDIFDGAHGAKACD